MLSDHWVTRKSERRRHPDWGSFWKSPEDSHIFPDSRQEAGLQVELGWASDAGEWEEMADGENRVREEGSLP